LPLDNKPKSLRVASFMMAGMFVLAGFSQARLQVFGRESTMEKARETRRFTLTRVDTARRGTIYTADMKPLAQDSQSYELNVQFTKVPHSDAFFMDLSQATGIPASEFKMLAKGGARSKSWLQPVPASRFKKIQEVRGRWRADGVSVTPAGVRDYPLGEYASSLVGVIRQFRKQVEASGEGDGAPKYESVTVRTGIEGSFNDELTGQDGMRVGLTDRNGAFLPMRMSEGGRPRIDGKDVVLTIDSDLQDAAAQAIRKAVDKHQADSGTAIIMDQLTGDILAMANWPSFDPNGQIPGEFGSNPAYMAQLEPGSTFKVLTLAKALEDGKTTVNERITCPGHFTPPGSNRALRCDKRKVHGPVDAEAAIAKSCNVHAAILATRVGRDEFIEFMEDLGILEKTGIGVPGEVHGLFRRNEYAKSLQLATVGFGQSVTATPLGITSAYSMIANDGVRMKPRLVKQIGDEVIPVQEGKRIVSEEVARQVRDTMEAVIMTDAGTGKGLRIPGYRLGGKTGTAEKVGYGKGYVANFIGFVPAHEPKAVVMVMVDNPKVGGYYGGAVAGPVFVDIAKNVIRRYNLPPDHVVLSSNPRR
jgi:cell division protein FtsI (penicillin-binding protein 3)